MWQRLGFGGLGIRVGGRGCWASEILSYFLRLGFLHGLLKGTEFLFLAFSKGTKDRAIGAWGACVDALAAEILVTNCARLQQLQGIVLGLFKLLLHSAILETASRKRLPMTVVSLTAAIACCAAAGRWAQAAQLLTEGRSMALEPTATLGAKRSRRLWHRQAKFN